MKRVIAGAESSTTKCSRREVLKLGSAVAAAYGLGPLSAPAVHAAEDNTIRLALIGTGGRGTGAVGNAIGASRVAGADCFGLVRLVAMADLFEKRLAGSHAALAREFGDAIDVPPERRFLGFDAYRKAIDCLRPGDVALLTTHAAFRPVHLDYAVERGVHVFMEKSFAADPAGLRRMLRAGERAKAKNLKIAAGLMCRHSPARQALIQKIRDGELGEILMTNAYRLEHGGFLGPRPAGENELLWQVGGAAKNHLLWSTGGWMGELMIHQIDECCWIKDGWPVAAQGFGGRVPHDDDCGQNHHTYSMEYTFADGTKALVNNRNITGCDADFVTYVHGTRCAAQFSGPVHQSVARMYKGQRLAKGEVTWRADRERRPLHQYEWEQLLGAIRRDRPHNETERAIHANFAAIMGRAAVHSGKTVTWDEVQSSEFAFVANIDALDAESPAPVKADEHGRYPAPVPGRWREI
jgi:predicted dehydrogenase